MQRNLNGKFFYCLVLIVNFKEKFWKTNKSLVSTKLQLIFHSIDEYDCFHENVFLVKLSFLMATDSSLLCFFLFPLLDRFGFSFLEKLAAASCQRRCSFTLQKLNTQRNPPQLHDWNILCYKKVSWINCSSGNKKAKRTLRLFEYRSIAKRGQNLAVCSFVPLRVCAEGKLIIKRQTAAKHSRISLTSWHAYWRQKVVRETYFQQRKRYNRSNSSATNLDKSFEEIDKIDGVKNELFKVARCFHDLHAYETNIFCSWWQLLHVYWSGFGRIGKSRCCTQYNASSGPVAAGLR